ncbi:PEP-CTERM sorting domain-containing protein [Psychromonas sp. MME2]|uniref:PEP-CTERM sorting domain-containing protein n=1 Tax=unclassified Psychromonas TaxID=2614957 RepID=UPI00339C8B43
MDIMRHKLKMVLGGVGALLLALTSTANAGLITCQDTAKNYMTMEDTYATGCVASGVGNINGNAGTDDFLTAGGTTAGYIGASVGTDFYNNGEDAGTWSVDSFVEAIGFKFGTGNTADNWFIFDLKDGVTSGTWVFHDVLAPGKGGDRLSHLQAYNYDGGGTTDVPAPDSLVLLLMGVGFVLMRRRVGK